MKKLVLPLLLLLGISMLLAQAVSEPSEVVGYVKYEVVAGNSMVALPMTSTLGFAGDVGSLLGATTVSYWSNADQAFVASEYWDFMDPPMWDNNFELVNGSVLLVNTQTAGTFYSIGGLPTTNPIYEVVEGNSMLMVQLDRSDLDEAGDVGSMLGATTVSYWSNADQAFVASEYWDFMDPPMWDNNFGITIGSPLLVNTQTAGTFPPIPSRTSMGFGARDYLR